MLQILGFILLIAIALALLKLFFAVFLTCCIFGIIAFLFVGAITGALTILGFMDSSTAWTLTKWAFYIGTAINIIKVIIDPSFAVGGIKSVLNSTSDNSGSSSSSSSNYSSEGGDEHPGVKCCGNCRFNNSGYGSSVSCNHNPAGEYNNANDYCSDYIHR